MKLSFAQTSNVKRFLAGVVNVERRGAVEASWLLATGEPGLGKTRTLQWYAVQSEAVYLRAKSNWRPRWMLEEIVRELGLAAAPRLSDLFNQAAGALGASGRALVIDEARNMLHDGKLLETLRDLSDMTEVVVILGGEEHVLGRIAARYPQIASRITEVVPFTVATQADVRAACAALCEFPVPEDLAAEILRQSGGYMREIKNAIAVVEQAGKRNGGRSVTLEEMRGQPLCKGGRRGARAGSAGPQGRTA